MFKSMTGYGSAVSETDKLDINVEIKSLNSKFLDLNLKLPKEFADKEIEVRALVSKTLERGKISLQIDLQQKGEVKAKVSINKELVKQYYKDLLETADFLGAEKSDLFKIALQMPRAVDSMEDEQSEEEWLKVLSVIQNAVQKCDSFRLDEGKVLAEKFKEYITKIHNLLEKIKELDPERINIVRERILSHFSNYNLADVMEKARFEQELIYYIEKLDITEEKVRLQNHLDYFLETMATENSGKKLGFISQEIGREINTIGSKANDSRIQKLVVEMKEELEKIKEQAMNIL